MVVLTTFGTAKAQVLQINGSGSLESGTGSFASIAPGTAFTFSETLNLATAALVNSGLGAAQYQDPNATLTFSFGTTTFTGSAPLNGVVSASFLPEYGYIIQSTDAGGDVVMAQLLTTDPITADTTLSSMVTFPASDFPGTANTAGYEDAGGDQVSGTFTSFSVDISAVPEPSTLSLFVGAGVLLLMWSQGRRIAIRRGN